MNNTHNITVVLENIRSALNVGAMFRTSDAAGITKLILSGITPYPPHNRIPKTALGAIDYVTWEHNKNSEEVIDQVSAEMPLVSIELTDEAIDYTSYEFPEPCAILFGNEITGVSDYAIAKSTQVVKVPMFGKKESLNVATTYGIIVYEIIRQWSK
ncbi:TrmH family RNA methyltransferase [Candidatus Dojkabacteria bacterium]|uniref:TrmH family RNA methyltransferase n=1 Tax=Candidatus Dojkabacteria bacterium TaxID=2099670 RepID=A0A955L627_9BACT|nr:TrmH family RNA methyltransferase [Candidatus Dojkabacteria bacterium]